MNSKRLAASAVVCLALGLTWAVAALAGSTATADNYVALGDSFSSGLGTSSYTLSSPCKRSVHAYPYLVARQRPSTALQFVACSGATTASVLSRQIPAANWANVSIVTITVGGNDIGFARLIGRCTLADCSAALDATRAALPGSLRNRLSSVYEAIKARAPGAKIVVLGYPRIFSSAECLATSGFSVTERSKANQLAVALDATIGATAAESGLTYRRALAPFTGHAVCSTRPWVNGLNLFATPESYHPNRSGQSQGYVPLVRSVVG